MQDSQEILSSSLDDFEGEVQGLNSATEAAEMLRQAAIEAGSQELQDISILVEKSKESGEEGLDALVEATDRVTKMNEGEIASDVRPKVERVMYYLLSEQVNKNLEIQLLKSAREVTNQQAQIGVSAEQRASNAREALQNIGDQPENVLDIAEDERGTEPLTNEGTHNAIRAAQEVGRPPDTVAYDTGFRNQNRLKIRQDILDMAYDRIRQLKDGEKVPDNVIDVLGYRPKVAQQALAYVRGMDLDQRRALGGTFSGFCQEIGLELPDDITSRLDKSRPTSPPPPG